MAPFEGPGKRASDIEPLDEFAAADSAERMTGGIDSSNAAAGVERVQLDNLEALTNAEAYKTQFIKRWSDDYDGPDRRINPDPYIAGWRRRKGDDN
jgi:hypothetical protein